ncbi:hypothetical protein [Coxiella-like endosymbiont]|uniref:hypothetical protein n=1 Tax=Coxiella-like endosymbiont TaxID=1592897 RepID=UPI0028689566|nr:hypothetical protein [Coxiella-like endosymbiont]
MHKILNPIIEDQDIEETIPLPPCAASSIKTITLRPERIKYFLKVKIADTELQKILGFLGMTLH